MSADPSLPHVVIVGAGFGGLSVARKLQGARMRVTVIDRSNHHLFQPLLYQVATASLSPSDIAFPVRSVFKGCDNVEVMLAEVLSVDPKRKVVCVRRPSLAAEPESEISYDYLVLATGSTHSYFGKEEWARHAPGLKSIRDATQIRGKVLLAFEAAEMETDEQLRRALLTFAIVGGGPTGVEMAGSIAELAHRVLDRDFRHIDPRETRIILIEANDCLLKSFPPKLSCAATDELERLGVEVRTNARVEQVEEHAVVVGGERIECRTIIWAAGVKASPAGQWLGAETDRSGRVKVLPDLTVPGHPDVFVIGDTAYVVQTGNSTGQPEHAPTPLPGLAPVAMQEGRYVARVLKARASGAKEAPEPFDYWDKGNLATIGRSFAVLEYKRLHMSGFFAWIAWVFVHIYYLIGFRAKVMVMLQWAWAYLTWKRGARLITPPAD